MPDARQIVSLTANPTGPRTIVPPADFVARGITGLTPAPGPSVTNHGGKLIGSVQAVPIYWGAAWASGANAVLATQRTGSSISL